MPAEPVSPLYFGIFHLKAMESEKKPPDSESGHVPDNEEPGPEKSDPMILFYVDESGTGLGDKGSPYFVLSAVSVSAQEWQAVDREVTLLKRGLIRWAKPEDYEIKGRDIRRGDGMFKHFSWQERLEIIHRIAGMMADMPIRVTAVQVDKQQLPEPVRAHDLMYRLALSRLLDQIESNDSSDWLGMIMFDSRSDQHSSIQDRRLIDAYRDWVDSRNGESRFVDVPWFGFSAFYAGLQLADFAAYMIDFMANEQSRTRSGYSALATAYQKLQHKVRLVRIPPKE